MKQFLLLLLGGSILSSSMVFGQPVGVPYTVSAPDGYVLVKNTNSLTKFDLDFSGGVPKDLVNAVEKVTGKPLNAVIANDCADLKIPAVSVKNVTTAELFAALKQVSKAVHRYCIINTASGREEERMERISTYGFQTEGAPKENSIWYFIKEGEDGGPYIITGPPACRFYQLSPYLEAGYKVEDVTTAIETGWKMLGITRTPEISYHKDTKVLIAVGEIDKLKTIDDLLKQLSTGKRKETINDKAANASKDP
jgi:hypothetical protein